MLRAAREAVGDRTGRARATEPTDEASPGQCERGGGRTPGDPPDPRGPACPRRLLGLRSLMGAHARPPGSTAAAGDHEEAGDALITPPPQRGIIGSLAESHLRQWHPMIADSAVTLVENDIVLRDGSTVHLRPVTPGDGPLVEELLRGLSPDSLATRFFSGAVDIPRTAELLVQVDGRHAFGLLALQGAPPHPVAHGLCVRTGSGRAEVAFTVAERFQGLGIASILLAQMAQAAHASGIELFEATVLPENSAMLDVFSHSGFAVTTDSEPGTVAVEFPTEMTPDAVRHYLDREETAAAAAVAAVLSPASVAVIGASREPGTIGGEIFHNLLEAGFNGPVYPVNPKATVIQSVPAYASVLDIPGPLDLAVVSVPAAVVLEVARECAKKEVRALVVISAGFAEAGGAGQARQAELLRICNDSGMRLVGPNCMGAINTSDEVSLNATFAPSMPLPGTVGFLSQSGALGLAIIDSTRALGIGLSSFVSVGNKADISGNDLLSFWERDPRTALIALYLESFGNPRKFAQIAGRVSKSKPIVAVRSGRGKAGARAAASHTASLVASSDSTIDALFRQTGVMRTETLSDMFDLLSLLATQPLPGGPRVAIITNAGGPAILCADACEANGLQVAELAEPTRSRLHAFLPPEAATGNPVDMIASASADDYRRTIEVVAADPAVDALIVIFTPPLVTRAEDVAAAIRDSAAELPRPFPLLTVFMTSAGVPAQLRSPGVQVPSYPFPENPARALGAALKLSQWRSRPQPGVDRPVGIGDRIAAAAAISSWLRRGDSWLNPAETGRLLSAYEIPTAPTAWADSPEAAAQSAEELGYPVVVKAHGPTILHKTELGAVAMGLNNADEVSDAAAEMATRLGTAGHRVAGFVVQHQMERGVELLVGAVRDDQFGTVVACGAGGTAVELLHDTSIRLAPVGPTQAREMLEELTTYPLLVGFRGAPPVDLDAAVDVIVRLAALAEDHSALAEIECNPVILTQSGAHVVDHRARIAAPIPPWPVGAKRLSA